MALAFTESSTDKVNHASGTSLDNIAQGTILFWIKPTNVTANFREICGKLNATLGTGINVFRVGANGNYRIAVNRATANQRVDIAVANLTANAWNFCAFTWDITNGGPTSAIGSLTSIAVLDSTNATDGSGAQEDDSTYEFIVGDADPSFTTVCIGADIAVMMVFNTDLSLGEIRQQQFWPHKTSNCVLLTQYGYNGTGTQPDWSGNNNNGTVTGATQSGHAPIPMVMI